MKRVLHIVGGMDRAGAETMIMNLYRIIDHREIQFDFLYFTNKKCDFDNEIESLGGKIYRIVESNPIKRFFLINFFLKKHNEFSVVHSHTLFNSGLNLLAAKNAQVPIRIAHSHSASEVSKGNILGIIYKDISRFLIKKCATSLIACGKDAGSFLFGKDTTSTIINNGIDINQYSEIRSNFNNYLNNIYNLPSDCIKIVQVGRLEKVKNHIFSLKIAERLKERNINFRMFFIGQGGLKGDIEKQIKKLNIQDFVTLTGIRNDVPKLMSGADVMLLPSFYEGFPLVLVEAQTIGLPSIISQSISKEVDLGLDLVKFKSIDNHHIDEWIEEILHSKRLKREVKSEILKEKGFDIKDNINILLELYKFK